MAPFEVVLVLLSAVVLSGVCARLSPVAVPLPLVQIACGALIGSLADLQVKLDPELFFTLFLPPILFFDGWRIPKEGLLRDKSTILALAIGLVVFTVVGLGLFVHWLIPAMPLAVAFALAAIISPTDATAVSAIAARAAAPKRLMHILQGESLLNDASGLVCMRLAVVAMLTGDYSFTEAVGTFAWLAVGGIAIGFALTWAVGLAKDWLASRYGEVTGSQILISLLMPFGPYLLADAAGCSGILAAVAAGVTMSYFEQRGTVLAITRIRRNGVWVTGSFAAGGIIFILLGEQLPQIVEGAARVVREAGHLDPAWLAVYVGAISLAVSALRFVWVWASFRFTFDPATRDGTAFVSGWRLIAATSFAGVRGTVTLAGVLALPFTLSDGSPFPARDLAIFLAAGVIVTSLVVAFLVLPALFRNLHMPPRPGEQEAEDRARIAAAEAAPKAIAGARNDSADGHGDAALCAEAAVRITDLYRQRIDAWTRTGAAREAARNIEEIERRLQVIGTNAERREIYRLARTGALSDETARRLVREIDLLEARLGAA